MNVETILYTILVLTCLGVLSAIILYFVAQKFKIHEDPRIDKTQEMLPGANCGACGFPGCRGLAVALVERDDISSMYCPVGGSQMMVDIAAFLEKAAPIKEPQAALVLCGGACDKRAKTTIYDGASSCSIATMLYAGDTACSYGCLGMGDCVVVCNFGAIEMNAETGLPEVDMDKCTACGLCVKACPKQIIELRKKGVKNRGVYVACSNKERGAVAKKGCSVACIGCGKCKKECEFEAITIENNLSYIDSYKCKLCRKCGVVCPTGAIVEINFPPRKKERAKEEASI